MNWFLRFGNWFVAKLLEYVHNGGNLFVIGADAVKEFKPQLGVSFEGSPETRVCTMGYDKQMSAVKTAIQQVKANDKL